MSDDNGQVENGAAATGGRLAIADALAALQAERDERLTRAWKRVHEILHEEGCELRIVPQIVLVPLYPEGAA